MSTPALSTIFFIQMFVILVVCRGVGWIARRYLRQPQVVGEMLAGILLGPTIFGLFSHDFQQFLFPPQSLPTLYVCAQLGVGLYMFLVGLEFRSESLTSQLRSATAVSLAGMIAPFLAALVLTPWLLEVSGIFTARAEFFEAFFFIGAAISITAFPTLARIVHERGLTGTRLGTLVLTAGAFDDVVAWCVIIVVLASFGQPTVSLATGLLGGLAFLLVSLTVVRWAMAKLGALVTDLGGLNNRLFGGILALLMLSMWVTDSLGIHVVFGAFVLGVAIPKGLMAAEIRKKLHAFVTVFLLPVFFVVVGLSMKLDITISGALYALVVIAILVASVLSKGVACWAAARLSGEDNRTSLAVGALMNCRGLMQIIVATTGLQIGLIEPVLFSALVITAVVTTFMATPLFEWAYIRRLVVRGHTMSSQLHAVPAPLATATSKVSEGDGEVPYVAPSREVEKS